MTKLPAKAIVGMVHLPALPGQPACDQTIDAIVNHALTDARTLETAGFDAIIVENFGDAPFAKDVVEPHIVAHMTRCVQSIVSQVSIPVGVNVLRNDVKSALAIAHACNGQFVRVNVHSGLYATDQGLIEGQAADTLAYRHRLCSDIALFADVHVKHATPISQPNIALAAEELVTRGRADALIVSGAGTAKPTDCGELVTVKERVPTTPVYVGSGVSHADVGNYLEIADGLIVGSALKSGGDISNPVDPGLAQSFITTAKR